MLGAVGELELIPLNLTLDSLHLDNDICIKFKKFLIDKVLEFIGIGPKIPHINEIGDITIKFRREQIWVAWTIIDLCTQLDPYSVSDISECKRIIFLFYSRI